jgi:hypothetical protein
MHMHTHTHGDFCLHAVQDLCLDNHEEHVEYFSADHDDTTHLPELPMPSESFLQNDGQAASSFTTTLSALPFPEAAAGSGTSPTNGTKGMVEGSIAGEHVMTSYREPVSSSDFPEGEVEGHGALPWVVDESETGNEGGTNTVQPEKRADEDDLADMLELLGCDV